MTKDKEFSKYNKIALILIPLILSAFTHTWNLLDFPNLHIDEGHYMRKTLSTMQGEGLQPQDRYFAPYFGQIFMAGILGLIGYPDSLNPTSTEDSIENLYTVPRLIMSIFAVIDTFLVYKITERKYGNKIAFIASILFAILPYGWVLRRIFLESIQLPLLLTSILLVLYLKQDLNKTKNTIGKRNISLILLSGIFLGLSIFTKVPVFTMIPVVVYLIYINTPTKKLKSIGLWFIPVLIIPLLWPAHAYSIGQFDIWVEDVLHQTQRESKPLINALTSLFEVDPILFILGISGFIYAAIKKDFFILLFGIPFLLFLYWLDFVSSFHLIILLPAFSIAGAKLIVELSNLIPNMKIRNTLPYIIISAIAIIGLTSIVLILSVDANSSIIKTQAAAVHYMEQSNSTVTIVSNPMFAWIPEQIFHIDMDQRSFFSTKPLKTTNYIIIEDSGYKKIMKENSKRGNFQKMLYADTNLIETIKPDNEIPKYDIKIYPYTNLKTSPVSKEINIRANY
ncbi:MAG: ArnT family glycosyltransferase [Nitrososphaeraceae archaeon]